MAAKKAKLSPEERRRAPREELLHAPPGDLRLYTEYRGIEVVQIIDISPFGLCLLLKAHVDKAAKIRVKYAYKGVQIKVSGTIAWRKLVVLTDTPPLNACGCLVGIFLHPNDIDANFALYQALAEGAKKSKPEYLMTHDEGCERKTLSGAKSSRTLT